jgi:chromosomal replication initiation ATPase DnaA
MKIDPKVRFIPVSLSLQGIPPEVFFERLYKAIVNKVNMNDIEEPEKIVDVEDFINAMSYIIESINNSSSIKSVIVLLLDEIELFNSYPLDLRESFRTVFMGPPEFSEHIRLIVTGTEIKLWTRSSPMNYLIEIEIEPLTAEEAREMILRPAKGVASFDDAAVDKIIEGTHGRPYEIQKICEQLIDNAIQKRVYRIKAEDVEELINSPEFKEASK